MLVISSHLDIPGPLREGLVTSCRTGDPWKALLPQAEGWSDVRHVDFPGTQEGTTDAVSLLTGPSSSEVLPPSTGPGLGLPRVSAVALLSLNGSCDLWAFSSAHWASVSTFITPAFPSSSGDCSLSRFLLWLSRPCLPRVLRSHVPAQS